MSVQAIAAVLDHSKARHGMRLTAISFANNADKHGLCFASVKLACDESLLERTAVKEAITKLKSLGELTVVVGADGKTHRPPLYWITLPGLSGEIAKEGSADRYFRFYGEDLRAEAESILSGGSENDPGGESQSDPGGGSEFDPGGVGKRPGGGRKGNLRPYRDPVTTPLDSVKQPDIEISEGILVPLQQIAELKESVLDLGATDRAIKTYPDRDHAAEADAMLGWHRRKPNAKLKDVARGFRNWLKGADPVPPARRLQAIKGGKPNEVDSPYGRSVVRSG